MIETKFLFPVAWLLLMPLVAGSQDLDFYYSPSRETVVIDYNYHCDPCIFGQKVLSICDCEAACQTTFDACASACQKMHSDLLDFELCLDECSTTYNRCKASCGFRLKEVKKISHFTINVNAYYAPIGQNPYLNKDSFQGIFYTGYNLAELNEFRWRPPQPPWPQVFYTHNTCFIMELTIYFGDGSNCKKFRTFCTTYG